MEVVWMKEAPTEIGFYWFYGHFCRHDQNNNRSKVEWHYVQVKKFPSGNAYYIVHAGFFYPEKAGDGWWTPVIFPSLPQEAT